MFVLFICQQELLPSTLIAKCRVFCLSIGHRDLLVAINIHLVCWCKHSVICAWETYSIIYIFIHRWIYICVAWTHTILHIWLHYLLAPAVKLFKYLTSWDIIFPSFTPTFLFPYVSVYLWLSLCYVSICVHFNMSLCENLFVFFLFTWLYMHYIHIQ